jgi:hypothetical protein
VKQYPIPHSIGGWVGPGAGLEDVEKIKILPLPGLELRTHGRPTQSALTFMCLIKYDSMKYERTDLGFYIKYS